MNPPVIGVSSNSTQVQLVWSSVVFPANGGLRVTSYEVFLSDSSDSTTYGNPASEVLLSTSLTITAGISAGKQLKFAIRAWNQLGAGDYSDFVTYTVPSLTDSVSTTSTSNIVFNTAPKFAQDINGNRVEVSSDPVV